MENVLTTHARWRGEKIVLEEETGVSFPEDEERGDDQRERKKKKKSKSNSILDFDEAWRQFVLSFLSTHSSLSNIETKVREVSKRCLIRENFDPGIDWLNNLNAIRVDVFPSWKIGLLNAHLTP